MNPEGLEGTFIDFYNNTFSIDAGVINLFHYIWGIGFIHKNTSLTILKHETSSKKSRDIDNYFNMFERSYVVPHLCKVSYVGLN